METWIWIITLIVVFWFGRRSGKKSALPVLKHVLNDQTIDRANYLMILRRELANIIVWRDPQRYLRLYKALNSELASLSSWRDEDIIKRRSALCEKYPNYKAFDAISTRDYVLYADGISWLDDDELEIRYKDIIMFSALSCIADNSWRRAAAMFSCNLPNDKELAHLLEYVQKIEDTKLALGLQMAVNDYYAMRRCGAEGQQDFDTKFYSIKCIPHFAENRYGIHLKNSGEFGVYAFYVFDDGHISHRFYRSDLLFEKMQALYPLNEVIKEVTLSRQGAKLSPRAD